MFPTAQRTQLRHDERLQWERKLRSLSSECYGILQQSTLAWVQKLQDLHDQMAAHRAHVLQEMKTQQKQQNMRKEHKRIRNRVESIISSVIAVADLVGRPPVVKMPDDVNQTLGNRKSLKQLKIRADGACGGAFALDMFLRNQRPVWKDDFDPIVTEMADLLQHYNSEVPDVRQQEVIEALQASADSHWGVLPMIRRIIEWTNYHVEEQAHCLEAANSVEGVCPPRPFSQRGIPHVHNNEEADNRLKEFQRRGGTETKRHKTTIGGQQQRRATVASAVDLLGQRTCASLACNSDRVCISRCQRVR